MRFILLLFLTSAASFSAAAIAADPPARTPTSQQAKFFETQVLPLLEQNCFKCHGEQKNKGGLRLNSRAGALAGGDLGPVIIPGQPDKSLLVQAVSHTGDLKMPPSKKLAPEQIAVLTQWVKMGAPWPGADASVTVTSAKPEKQITDKDRAYWAYRPRQRHAAPTVKNTQWVQGPIDAFILAQLEAKGLSPNPPADRVALIRRATYDLTGLPPKPEEVDAFVADKSPKAYEKLIDRLLATPQYGEKWGRHWLDLVRYAETNGYERDGPKPFAWRYRDYVIKSFNDDKPFDRFIREQLAGDELPDANAETVIATGYYRLGIWDDEPVDAEQARFDELDDIVATTSQVFLGMTMNCARCHDHKIDPILQADYYRMVAFFRDVPHYSDTRDVSSRFNMTDISPPEVRAKYEQELKRREARLAELSKDMRKIEDDAISRMPEEDQRAAQANDRSEVLRRKLKDFLTTDQAPAYAKLKKESDDLKRLPPLPRELALSVNNCVVHPPQTHVLIRGNAHAPGKPVAPGFPQVLDPRIPTLPMPGPKAKTSGRRTILADWIANPQNPMTSRVLANRLWQHHFGRGIVASTNDFGQFGTLPTHPQLLDWLADDFVTGGWRLKRMHKTIMISSAYQMSSQASPAALKADPANQLFWRFNPRRLTAEEVRDSTLAVSGKLNLKAGGPSIFPPIPPEVLAGQSVPGQGWGKSSPVEASRRSVYVHIKRSLLVPILSQHDQADTDSSCPVRYTTTVPTQALGLLNGAFTREQAAALAERLRREAPGDVAEQVRRAIRLTTGRHPATAEVDRDLKFILALQTKDKLDERMALQNYCLLALNTNEFFYLD